MNVSIMDRVYDVVSRHAGNVNSNVLPAPELRLAHMRPPCCSMIDRQIDSPMPMPWDLVVKNASKMRLIFFGSIPVPESSTVINT